MTKASSFRDMTVVEIESTLVDLNRELFTLVNEMRRTKKLEQPHLIRKKKKDKARLLTVLHEKQSKNLKSS